MSLNNKLNEIYSTKWDELIDNGTKLINPILSIKDIDISNLSLPEILKKQDKKIKNFGLIPSNPLLLQIDEEEFKSADIKVMIFGQETFGWHEFSISIEKEMESYKNFFNNGNVTYKGNSKSSFWKAFRWFRQNIDAHYKDKKVTYFWNNISKMGRYEEKAGVPTKIKELERTYFNHIIEKELELLKPDMVIFLTGNRNDEIRFNFKNVEMKDIHYSATLKSNNGKIKYQKAQYLIHDNLPKKTIKLYHPSFFGGFNNIKEDALKFILDN